MAKIIKLTKNLETIVDDHLFDELNSFNWHVDADGYVVRNSSRKDFGSRKKLLMHREILKVSGAVLVDHLNHNILDNRTENLRVADFSQNQANKLKQPGKSSIYKGVSYNKKNHKWEAHCTKDQKKYSLGYHLTEVEAALAYNIKAKEFFGEFALLNQIK